MFREFKQLVDVYDEDEDGNDILLKRDAVIRDSFYVDSIVSVTEALNRNGNPYKSRCFIYHAERGNILLKHPYKEIVELKEEDELTRAGFKIRTK